MKSGDVKILLSFRSAKVRFLQTAIRFYHFTVDENEMGECIKLTDW
jgi:hypothetical protein